MMSGEQLNGEMTEIKSRYVDFLEKQFFKWLD